jgi:ubiquinone/menaquinone biosynthesis C-methylase UbiE
MPSNDNLKGKRHPHRGKFTEGLLDTEVILNALNIRPGQTILDAGCGNGYMSKVFSKAVGPSGKVYALDPDSTFIAVLKNETRESNIEAMQADITLPTPLTSSSMDLIYVSTVIHAFSRPQVRGFIREAERLLKPRALLAIVEIEKKDTPFGPPLNLRYSPEELKAVFPMAAVDTVAVGEHFYMQVFQNREKHAEE